jgi:hypothetical protein
MRSISLLAPALLAICVGCSGGGTSINTTINAKDYGALGTGYPIDDTAAILAAAASVPASGGTLEIPAGTYYSAKGINIIRNNLTVIGEGMPTVSSDLQSLKGGTIIQNQFQIVGSNITVQQLGVDSGITFSNAHMAGSGTNGLVIHDPANHVIYQNVNVKDCVGLCRIGNSQDSTAAFHAILLEGIQNGSADNLLGIGGWFGIVLKVSDFTCGSLQAQENDAASVLIKSQSYAPVARVKVGSVTVQNSANSRGYFGFEVVACDAALSDVTVGTVNVTGGGSAVGVTTEGSFPVDSVSIGTVTAQSPINGISVLGTVQGLVIDKATITLPTLGLGLTTGLGGLQTTDQPLSLSVKTLRVVPGPYAWALDIASPSTVATFGIVDVSNADGSIGVNSKIDVQPNTVIGQCIGTIVCH